LHAPLNAFRKQWSVAVAVVVVVVVVVEAWWCRW